MSLDFFLQNRAHQVLRICRSTFEIPGVKQRAKLPATLLEFYRMLDRICAFAEDESSPVEGTSISDSQRRDLLAFEKVIVDNRFSADPQLKTPAVALIRAIFADTDYFSGLKPLPQYTDVFAYELLFPSWLNLLTALMLPRADNGKPKMSGAQQGELFAFLSKLSELTEQQERQLIGFMTLIARRFDAPECECLLQRFVDLLSVDYSIIDSIDRLDLGSKDARQFATRLEALLAVRHSSHKWPSQSQNRIAETRPTLRVIPTKIRSLLESLENSGDNWEAYSAIAQPLSVLIRSEKLLANEYSVLLDKYPERAAELMQILVTADKQILCDEGQICVAILVNRKLQADTNAALSNETEFSKSMAGYLSGYSESTLAYFVRQFIADEKNSSSLLDCCASPEKKPQLEKYLLEKAAKTDDDKTFMNLLCCVTVVSSDDATRTAKHALQAIEAVVSNRSIGSKELSDLIADLQANTSEALRYLSSPIMAAAGKSSRLASLYLTLNEITEVFQSSGNVGNFSVVRAKYSSFASGDPS